MSLTFKLLSLAVRTAAKPIGNYIKRQAREHEGFRRFAVNQAQRVHRIDMRMRLGLLHDTDAQQRMHEREQQRADEKKRKAEAPTVRSEEEQKQYDEQKVQDEKDGVKRKDSKSKPEKAKIRPLSDSRAIELGANFFSEAFIFAVAVGLLLAENFRSSRKASNRRDELAERLDGLEAEVQILRKQHNLPELEALNEQLKRGREERDRYGWYNPAGWWRKTDPVVMEASDQNSGETAASGHNSQPIPGNVPGSPSSSTTTVPTPANAGTGASTEDAGSVQRIQTVFAAQKGR